MYVYEIRKDTAEDADLYEELRDAWDGIDYAGLPSFDDVLPDILEWVRGYPRGRHCVQRLHVSGFAAAVLR